MSTLAEISTEARKAPCAHCGAGPLEDCWPGDGLHVLRLAAAYKTAFITEGEFFAVLDAMDAFTASAMTGRAA